MDVNIEPSWRPVLAEEFKKEYFKILMEKVEEEYAMFTCYPPRNQIFSAFNHTPFNEVKVVILGQDPYHGPGQANGLSFSVNDGIKKPPSLVNIFKQINSEVGSSIPTSGNLEHWAQQGVLLLNAILTVKAHKASSHQKIGWELFTDTVISKLSEERKDIVFLLWGGYAKKKGAKINKEKHLVLESGHPSPLSANRGYWFGNEHFSKANKYIIGKGKKPIDWLK
jgi:uracil-DNA glycosylase